MKDFSEYRTKLSKLFRQALAYSQLQFFPNRSGFRGYNRETFQHDLSSAINVAVLAFPQGIAFALMAGLPVEYGIYGSAVAAIVAPFFSSSRFTIIGPTNATAVLILSSFLAFEGHVDKAQVMGLLLLMVGVFVIAGSFLRIASLLQYVSRTVITGYITAAAALIMVNQAHNVLGYPLGDVATFFDVCYDTIRNIPNVRFEPLIIGAVTFSVWYLCTTKLKKLPSVAVALLAASLVNFSLGELINFHVECLTALPMGYWPVHVPDLDWKIMSQIVSVSLAVAFLCVLEANSIGRSIANRAGDRLDGNQEMLGVGVANLACAFFSGMPASGSLTRSSLNWTSGAVTSMASIMNGILCAIGALLLGPLFVYIPKASLAVIVISVGFSLISPEQIRIAVRSTKSDRAVFYVTLAGGLLFALDFAIYVGVATSILLFLRKASRPELVEYSFDEHGQLCQIDTPETRPTPHISIVHVEGDLFFGASELFRDQVRLVAEDKNLKVIILRLKNAYHLDATSVMALEELVKFLRETDRHLIVSGARKDVYRVFKNSGLLSFLGRENFFLGSPANPNVATRNALKRAKELLGDNKADIRIFYDPAKQDKKS